MQLAIFYYSNWESDRMYGRVIIKNWFNMYELSLNIAKTEYITYSLIQTNSPDIGDSKNKIRRYHHWWRFEVEATWLIPIIQSVILLGRQNIAFRSHRNDSFSSLMNKRKWKTTTAEYSVDYRGNFKAILDFSTNGDLILNNHLMTVSAKSTYISKNI